MIIGANEPARGVQTEARTELSLYGEAEQFKFGDGQDGLVEVLGMYSEGSGAARACSIRHIDGSA